MRDVKMKTMLLLLAALLTAGCVSGPQNQSAGGGCPPKQKKTGPVKIGFSMDTVKEERWQRDRELVDQHAKEVGAQARRSRPIIC